MIGLIRGGVARRVHFFCCMPLVFVREGSVTRLDGCDCALAFARRVASMSDSRPELRSSVGRGDAEPRANSHAAAPLRLMRRRGLPIQMPPSRPALSQEGSTKSVQIIIPSVIDTLANSKIRFDSVKRVTQIQNTS